jgi:Ni/Co efflux regulator RcnB
MMKRLLTAAVALSLLGGTAAIAQPYHHDNGRHNGWDKHDRRDHHRWQRGQRLPAQYYRDRGYYVDYRAHHLRAPPRGYRWVHVDNDYVLVAAATGLIASIIAANQ